MGNLGNYPASPKHRQFIRWLGVKNITTYLFLLILGLILENAGYGMLIPVINIIADGSQQNISIGPITVVGGITPIIAFVIVLVTLRAVIALSTVRFGAFLTGDWHNRMRVHLHNQLHCPSGVETHSHKTGEIVNTVVGETWSASEYCRHFLVMISRLIALFTYVAILLWLSLEMTLGLLFFVSPVVLFAYLLNRRTREIGKTILNLNNDLYDTAIASVSARFTITVYGLEDRFRSKFSKISKQILNNEIKSTWYGSIIPEISSLIVIPVIIGLTLYAKAQEMPIGEIVVFSLILFRAVPQANSVLRDFSGLARHRASFDKIRASMVPWNQKEDHRTKRHLEDIKLLELDHMSFKFPNSRPIITDFNALLSTGNVYQLNGISGSGKSTVISIILGVIKPDVGSIRINNIPLQELNHEEFRSQIGYAGQQSAIFESSIQNNIELWRQVNKFRLQQIGKMLSIDKISAELKDGYNTHLGVGGVSISGGQKQRICIARAIAMNPSIIILDEATSELDIDAEQSVLNAIYDLCPKSIILIVSHRIEAHTQNNNICITHREDINPTTDADY